METTTEYIVQLREMTPSDLPHAHALSREQRWPHRQEDWRFLLQVGGGFVAERDGEIVGTAMGWPFGANAATLGMVIVSPSCQGGGIGRQLMHAVLDMLGDRTVMLNATDEGLPLYKSLGFVAAGSIFQHQGAAFAVPIPELQANERVRPMGSNDRAAAPSLDHRATGMDRGDLIAKLRKMSKGVVLTRNDESVGFALFRRFGQGYAIGPTIAPDAGGAKALISHWLGSNAGMFCRLDVPGESGLSGWLDDLGLPCVGRVTSMVCGTPPARDDAVRVFSVVNQALG